MHIDQFVGSIKSDIEAFEKYWKNEHEKDPISFPLDVPSDNSGIWFEQFEAFQDFRNENI